ncbi:MAG: hypothetical protein WCI71_11820 [Bacteroidota bacterium]
MKKNRNILTIIPKYLEPFVDGDSHKAVTFNHFPARKTDITGLPALPQFVQITISPSSGFTMAFRCSKVILGARNPIVELFTSRIAELSGALPSVFTATWLNNEPLVNDNNRMRMDNFSWSIFYLSEIIN